MDRARRVVEEETAKAVAVVGAVALAADLVAVVHVVVAHVAVGHGVVVLAADRAADRVADHEAAVVDAVDAVVAAAVDHEAAAEDERRKQTALLSCKTLCRSHETLIC